MTRKYSKAAGKKIERTMHEFKHGTLKSGSGGKVKSRKQAVAIALSQARRHGYKVPAAHATRRGPSQEDIDREAARAKAATASATVTAYPFGPYVDEAHISISTTLGDLASSHSRVYQALKAAGITPTKNYPGTFKLMVDEDVPLSKAKALIIATLRDAGIKVYDNKL